MSFDVPAESYDRFMGRFSVPLAALFADWAQVSAPARVLDVGCGTGALTGELVDRLGADAVTAVDPSEPFVAAARKRFPGVDVRLASAEKLPFESNAYDATLAELVVHLMPDAAAGAREMLRVTRPGGTVAACVWDFAGHRAPQTLFFTALRAVAPEANDESERLGARAGELATLLRNAGGTDASEGELSVEVAFSGFDEWWEPYTLGVGPAGQELARLSPADQDRVQHAARSLVPDAPFRIAATAWAARARVRDH
jgi:ubiquinone/menaquinone biosynthesis C-methylase UbiE